MAKSKHHWNPHPEKYKTNRILLTDRELVKEIQSANRAALAQAITRVETQSIREMSEQNGLLYQLQHQNKDSVRIAITGSPGVGKSTFIEDIGWHIVQQGHRLAVLPIDPSSRRTKGSILGDKTRMQRLANHPNAFIRPSSAGKTLGGISARTRENIVLCEAAGYDIIMVETVGVGQSETAIKDMVDMMILLLEPGAGDELQGIKRGIMELADMICITKAKSNPELTKRTMSNYQKAIHILQTKAHGIPVEIIAHEAISGQQAQSTWALIDQWISKIKSTEYFDRQRIEQHVKWYEQLIENYLIQKALYNEETNKQITAAKEQIKNNNSTAIKALHQIIHQIDQLFK